MLTEQQRANLTELVARLRSGRYTQGHRRMRLTTDRGIGHGVTVDHCCLGVAAEMMVEQGHGAWYGDAFGSMAGAHGAALPEPLWREHFGAVLSQDKLFQRNDAWEPYGRHTFAMIADYIDERIADQE